MNDPHAVRTIPQSFQSYARLSRFALVGLSGIAVNQLALLALAEPLGLHYLLAAVIATQGSSSWNFLGTERWVFAGRPHHGRGRTRYAAFMAMSNAALIARIPMLWALVTIAGLHYLAANVVTLLALFLARYALSDGWIWRGEEPHGENFGTRVGEFVQTAESRHAYDIAGILRLHSAVELPELLAFKTDVTDSPPDLRITIAAIGKMPRLRTRFDRIGEQLTYSEQLGLAGANFRVTMGQPIEVQATPLLALSRHVLYTNVIEALLRFLLVSKGYVLLHSACVMVDGRAALLSAQTDTGKTSTVIKLVRDHGYQFLSDDMTIIGPGGQAIHYPKPMTLSFHTMSSIRGEDLSVRERASLAIQSRLHSKSGRSVGKMLGSLNVPIMSINSVVQAIVPPPKYHIDRLMPCELGQSAPIGHVFVMERGEDMRERLSVDEAAPQLIENTDDAYGFPPFSTFAPHLRIGGDDYAGLRAKEEQLLRAALAGATMWRLRVPGHGWAELLPSLLADSRPHRAPEVVAVAIAPGAPRVAEALGEVSAAFWKESINI